MVSNRKLAIVWWNALDLIGVDTYYPLTNQDNPSVSELVDACQPHLSVLEGISSKFDLPVVITEIGYRSVNGANQRPFFWNPDGSEIEFVDLKEQQNAYQAACESLSTQDSLAGIYWWMWETDPLHGGSFDLGYSPNGKIWLDSIKFLEAKAL